MALALAVLPVLPAPSFLDFLAMPVIFCANAAGRRILIAFMGFIGVLTLCFFFGGVALSSSWSGEAAEPIGSVESPSDSTSGSGGTRSQFSVGNFKSRRAVQPPM